MSPRTKAARLVILALLLPAAAFSHGLEIGAGKALNNCNTRLPAPVYSGRAIVKHGAWSFDAAYTRIGKSQVGENAAISSVGASRAMGRWSFGAGVITGASYSAAVWWDKANPHPCGVDGCGIRYANDGKHFSRACHLCGAELSIQYALTRRFAVRGEYIGLRHMTPTFQGVVLQLTYEVPL